MNRNEGDELEDIVVKMETRETEEEKEVLRAR